MKKLFIGLGVLALIGATSCKKDYTCECKQDGNVVGTSTFKDTKKNAKEKCEDSGEVTVTVNGQSSTTKFDCKIK